MKRSPFSSSGLCVAVCLSLVSPTAVAQEAAAPADPSRAGSDTAPTTEAPASLAAAPFARRLRGSTLTLDQSMTTQTAQLEASSPQQSYVPLYEWWLSLRPRYWLDDHVFVWGRFDFYKELTNSQPTTDAHEDVFGDVWTGAGWQTALGAKRLTKLDAGVRALLPTSKASQAAGVYFTGGLSAGASQKFPLLRGTALSDGHLGLSLTYQHPFSRATTPVSYGDFGYARQDVDGRSFVSDQLRGSTLASHQLVALLDAGLTIAPKLSWTVDMIFVQRWQYAPTDGVAVQTATGSVSVSRSSDATTFGQSTWFLTSLDYDLVDEVSLSLGYYNLANVVAPDGQRRGVFGADNIWWSPDARVFFDVVVHLDALWGDAAGSSRATRGVATRGALGTH